MKQLCLAAADLERIGLCHGDIRPGNMLLNANRDLFLAPSVILKRPGQSYRRARGSQHIPPESHGFEGGEDVQLQRKRAVSVCGMRPRPEHGWSFHATSG